MTGETKKQEGESASLQDQQRENEIKSAGGSEKEKSKGQRAVSENENGPATKAVEEKAGTSAQKEKSADQSEIVDKFKYFAVFGILFLVCLGLIIRNRYR